MSKREWRKAKTLVLMGLIVFSNFLFLSSYFSPIAYSQPETTFNSTDKFEIPSKNGSVSFASNGTYENAFLENGKWNFEDLHLASSEGMENFSLKVSAGDSEVEISFIQNFNRIFGGDGARWVILSYTVVGHGTQTFDLGLDPNKGRWDVILNGEFVGATHGWKVSSEGTPIITGATANVTIFYYGYPNSYINRTNDINEHHILITSTFFVAVVAISAVIITSRNKEPTQPIEKTETTNSRHFREEFA